MTKISTVPFPDVEPQARVNPVRLRSIIGGLMGNVIEWYDFLAYSIFSIYFAKAFFPADNPTVQLMNAAAIAAVGYIARPVGSWLSGFMRTSAAARRRSCGRSWACALDP